MKSQKRRFFSPIFGGYFVALLALSGCDFSKNYPGKEASEASSSAQLPHIRVTGESMAPKFLGEHRLLTCPDCNWSFAIDIKNPPREPKATCPHCGSTDTPWENSPAQLGTLLPLEKVDRLDRFDVIAFRFENSDRTSQPSGQSSAADLDLGFKRIWGLPGENIAIENGELFVNGKLFQKSLRELRSVMTVVHDSKFSRKSNSDSISSTDSPSLPASSTRSPSWLPDSNSGWSRSDDGWISSKNDIESKLTFTPYRCVPRAGREIVAGKFEDYLGYNQGDVRSLNDTDDLVLSIDCRLTGTSRLGIVFPVEKFLNRVELSWRPSSTSTDRYVISAKYGSMAREIEVAGRESIHLSMCDDQLIVAIEDRELIVTPLQLLEFVEAALPAELSVSALGDPVHLEHLVVARDLVLTDLNGGTGTWTMGRELGAKEYLVLGDNMTHSSDSRHWKTGIFERQILGQGVVRSH